MLHANKIVPYCIYFSSFYFWLIMYVRNDVCQQASASKWTILQLSYRVSWPRYFMDSEFCNHLLFSWNPFSTPQLSDRSLQSFIIALDIALPVFPVFLHFQVMHLSHNSIILERRQPNKVENDVTKTKSSISVLLFPVCLWLNFLKFWVSNVKMKKYFLELWIFNKIMYVKCFVQCLVCRCCSTDVGLLFSLHKNDKRDVMNHIMFCFPWRVLFAF